MDINHLMTEKGTSYAVLASDPVNALRDLIEAIGYTFENLTPDDKGAVAFKLSRIAGVNPPWTWRYVHNVLTRAIEPSRKFSAAILTLLAVFDGANPLMVKAHRVQVFAVGNVDPGAIVFGNSVKCASDGCPVHFVPRVWNQRYCSQDCKRQARKII